MRENVSFPVDRKVIILEALEKNDSLLFLYGENVEKRHLFHSFINVGLKNNELCLYAFNQKSEKLELSATLNDYIAIGRLHAFPIETNKTTLPKMDEQDRIFNVINELNNKLFKMYSIVRPEGRPLRVVIDFGKIANPSNIEDIINFEKEITRKVVRLSLQEKRKARAKHGFSFTVISAFNVNSLDNESMSRLIKLHTKIVISAHNETTLLLPYFSSRQFDRKPTRDIKVISRENVERAIKSSLDVITLSLLQREPMCGYEVIRTIAQKYHVLLSQGTVYPLLYSLKNKGILRICEGGGREKVYALTEKGEKTMEAKLNDFAKTHEYLLGLIVPSSTLNK